MSKAYIFDWGDTLMVDFPGVPSAMKDWPQVEAIEGAEAALQHLSKLGAVYVATGARLAKPEDIEAALARVNLSRYVTSYFCKENIGHNKPSPEFYSAIAKAISLPEYEITMVGDNLEKDVLPPLSIGMNAIWFNGQHKHCNESEVKQIESLYELCS